MSRQEGKVIRPFEYCLEKAKLALEDQFIPELRQEIIHGELSPDKAWREARHRLQKLRATEDLSSEDKALATSYWWLAKTKRDHREKFEERINQNPKEEKKMKEGKNISEFEFELPPYVELKTTEFCGVRKHFIKFVDRFPGEYLDYRTAKYFCMEILGALAESAHQQGQGGPAGLINDLVQFLEKEFGLKVKICGNCKYWKALGETSTLLGRPLRESIKVYCNQKGMLPFDTLFEGCEHWAPKEVLEKK